MPETLCSNAFLGAVWVPIQKAYGVEHGFGYVLEETQCINKPNGILMILKNHENYCFHGNQTILISHYTEAPK